MSTKINDVNTEMEEDQSPGWYQILPNPNVENGFVLRLQDIEHDQVMKNLSEFLTSGLADREASTLLVDIFSHGGSFDTTLELWTLLTSTFKRENITTRISAHGYSAGAYLFMLGNTRVMGESASIMIHNMRLGSIGDVTKIRAELDREQMRLNRFIYSTFGINDMLIADLDLVTSKEEDLYYDVIEACVKGICTHVQTFDGEIVPAEMYAEQVFVGE